MNEKHVQFEARVTISLAFLWPSKEIASETYDKKWAKHFKLLNKNGKNKSM